MRYAPTDVFGGAQDDDGGDVAADAVPCGAALVQPGGGDGINRRHSPLPGFGCYGGVDLVARPGADETHSRSPGRGLKQDAFLFCIAAFLNDVFDVSPHVGTPVQGFDGRKWPRGFDSPEPGNELR